MSESLIYLLANIKTMSDFYHSFIAILTGYALLSTVYAVYLNRKIKRVALMSQNAHEQLRSCSDSLVDKSVQLEKHKREIINLTEKVSHIQGHLDQCRQDSNKTIKMVKDMEKAEDKLHAGVKKSRKPRKASDNNSK